MNLSDTIQSFEQFLTENSSQDIIIRGNFGTNNHSFLSEIINLPYFQQKNTLIIDVYNKKSIQKILKEHHDTTYDCIVLFSEIWTMTEFRNILGEHNIRGQIILPNQLEDNYEDDISIFIIPTIHFREYLEMNNIKISIPNILQNKVELDTIEPFIQAYKQNGSFIKNIDANEYISEDFYQKCTIISEELFEKEREEFMNFLKVLALNMGNLHKEDRLAQNMNISRRKVRKYTELLEKYDIIRFLEPFVGIDNKELSRHRKAYFSDLSYYSAILGENYGIGSTKAATIENFVFLELTHKTQQSHQLFFWKKKSGTGLSFVLENRDTGKITPIELDPFGHKTISPTMKSFYESYSNDIEYGMILTEHKYQSTQFDQKSFLILPYYTI